MKVLVACEESQRVCVAFRKRGHEAYSCDIIEPSGGHPEWHIQGDVIPILAGGCVKTMDGVEHQIGKWDLIIAHPPCQYLTVTANRWHNVEKYGEKAIAREYERDKAIEFFLSFTSVDCPRIAIENPIGIMPTFYRKPDQIIHPYHFGHPISKATCLWLKGLPKLMPTCIVKPKIVRDGMSGPAYHTMDERGKILGFNDPETAKIRSKTYKGIARAMAEQWG